MITLICGLAFLALLGTTLAGNRITAKASRDPQAENEANVNRATHPLQRRLYCTNGTIQGRFAMKSDGVIVGVGPFAAVGIITFDGFGSVTNAATTSTNGNISTGVGVSTYSVNDDCSGQMAISSVAGPPLTFNIAVADRGDEVQVVATRAPAVIAGVARRVD